jgi:filamin
MNNNSCELIGHFVPNEPEQQQTDLNSDNIVGGSGSGSSSSSNSSVSGGERRKSLLPIMRNQDDKWIVIQKNTFTNWINEQLKSEKDDQKVVDLRTDFTNGVKLLRLVDSLQQPNSKVSKRYFKNPTNQHQCLENVSLALNAITEDGIRLVNIGNTDLTNGNLKLILGLIWHLILRYQIGKIKIPPKKLLLAWIKSVLPGYHVTNLTLDLNDGLIIA